MRIPQRIPFLFPQLSQKHARQSFHWQLLNKELEIQVSYKLIASHLLFQLLVWIYIHSIFYIQFFALIIMHCSLMMLFDLEIFQLPVFSHRLLYRESYLVCKELRFHLTIQNNLQLINSIISTLESWMRSNLCIFPSFKSSGSSATSTASSTFESSSSFSNSSLTTSTKTTTSTTESASSSSSSS